jgi:chromosome partitioning protein
MILVVGGTKGGSGKTLLASNFTVLRAVAGHDTLLIDVDEQSSAMDFTRQRQRRLNGEPGYTAIQTREADVAVHVHRMVAKYTDIVIDVGGRDTASQRAALTIADMLVIPFTPTSVDLGEFCISPDKVNSRDLVVLKNSAASISGHIPGWYILEHAMTSLPPA